MRNAVSSVGRLSAPPCASVMDNGTSPHGAVRMHDHLPVVPIAGRKSAHDSRGSVFFFQAEDGIRDYKVTGVQTCALPISMMGLSRDPSSSSRFRQAWNTG